MDPINNADDGTKKIIPGQKEEASAGHGKKQKTAPPETNNDTLRLRAVPSTAVTHLLASTGSPQEGLH